MRARQPLLLPGLLVAGALALAAGTALGATPGMEAGGALFTAGARPGAAAPLARAAGGASLPASALPCAACHGADGQGGRAEAGVRPPAITWSALSRPAAGRPAYDAETLLRAVVQGTAAGGRALDDAMPRYALTMEDGQALVAFLRGVESRPVPGVGPAEVRFGLLLPAGPVGEAFAASFQAALEAAAPAGVFGRRIALVRATAARPGEGAAAARELASREVFALVSALPAELDGGAIGAARAAGLPILSLRAAPEPAPMGFALLPGAAAEALALLHDVANAEHAVLLAGPAPAEQALAEAIAEAIGRQAESDPRILAREELTEAALAGASALVVLGPAPLPPPALAALRALPGLQVLLPAAAAGPAAAPLAVALDRPVAIGFGVPPMPGGAEGPAAARFAAGPGPRAGLPGRLGHAAGEVVVEALRRAGRALTQDRLAAALRAPEAFETGTLPALVPQRAGAAGGGGGAGRIWTLRMGGDGRLQGAATAMPVQR